MNSYKVVIELKQVNKKTGAVHTIKRKARTAMTKEQALEFFNLIVMDLI